MRTEIEHHQIGNASLVRLPQQLVMAVAPTVRAALAQLVESGHKRLVLDMRDIRYVDSSGLSVLIAALKNAHQHSGAVVLLDPTPDVRALIELTRLHQVFDIYKDENAAIEGLNS
jgi:anti-sigma B factor antagonist